VSGRLDETVPAFREALQENIRERVPLDWAITTGDQGAALKLLAKWRGRCGDARNWRREIPVRAEEVQDTNMR
jgi:hypothetical protein